MIPVTFGYINTEVHVYFYILLNIFVNNRLFVCLVCFAFINVIILVNFLKTFPFYIKIYVSIYAEGEGTMGCLLLVVNFN